MENSVGDRLLILLKQKKITQAELSRKAGRSKAAISDVISGRRNLGVEFAKDIADALDIPPEEFLRMMDILPPKPKADNLLERIDYLYHSLRDPGNKKRALEYMEFLKQQDEKGDYDERKSPSPQPR